MKPINATVIATLRAERDKLEAKEARQMAAAHKTSESADALALTISELLEVK